MPKFKTWLVDFDETLASGSITWAFQNTFPAFIRDYGLNADSKKLREVMFVLQERASQVPDPTPLLKELFTTMNWPHELAEPLLNDLFSNYQPRLFDDTLPFLRYLQQNDQHVFVISNNPHTLDNARQLDIGQYVNGIITPWTYPDTLPKPNRSLWDYIVAHETDIDPRYAIVVGDDPWSDGAFAEACGLTCWIVDRLDRFSELCSQRKFQRVRTLAEITL